MKKKKKHSQIKKTIQETQHSISPVKKTIFTLIVLLIPIFLLIFLEFGLRIFNYGGNTKLFVSTPNEDSPYYGINLDVPKRYFFMESFIPSPRKDLFLKQKKQDSFRIFVLGGSTTAGFPHGNNLTFTRILNRRLADTFPDRRIEVVNTAFTAINSYTMVDFIDEILGQKPDAILIYAGHNEFYGALGVGSTESYGKIHGLVRTYLRLQKFRFFVLLRNVIGNFRKWLSGKPDNNIAEDPMETIMSRIVKEQTIPLNSPLYKAGIEQFRRNLHEILQKCQKNKIPVLLSELVSNIRDQKPFISVKSDTLPTAQSLFDRARSLEKAGQFEAARNAYYRAKDLDALRFRATEEINMVIHKLAAEFHVQVVPMRSIFEKASPNGLIGHNLMHEHLHPNIDGYFLMADAFFTTMQREQFISPNWPKEKIRPLSYYRENWGITRLDSIYSELVIVHLKGGWPFKTSGRNVALFDFSPVTKADSIALKILLNKGYTLEFGHIDLAEHFKRQGDIQKALEEYKALIYTVPHLDLFYEPMIELAVTHQQYSFAINLLIDALKFNESGFIYKWLGQLYLIYDYEQQGILYLEKACELLPQDIQVRFNLGRAYFKTSRFTKGNEIIAEIKRIDPKSPFIKMLEDNKKNQ